MYVICIYSYIYVDVCVCVVFCIYKKRKNIMWFTVRILVGFLFRLRYFRVFLFRREVRFCVLVFVFILWVYLFLVDYNLFILVVKVF